ncbi:Cytochrome c oxidase subunit IV [Nakamurella panacisegetis]|uniref:cytochrome-c oxidase n=1 Tax=Nakamurella panacisegetis TaxID=1090615 RepID=A0A1H0R2E7_9ACTN|nr:cytochrome c oxidase subunit 4 [Nakamurella panacisegetis]SDP23236.1 Cytochrome c oxidase subunit IV [Nakamurella panacisegetis]
MAVDHASEVEIEDAAPPKRGLNVEAWIFLALTAFFFLATVLYAIFAGSVEPVGVVALALTTGLSLIIGTFLMFASRRLEQARPEDNENAHVSDGAGDIGFFSPGSYWPFGMALAAAFTAVATAFLLVWLMIITIGFLLITVCGLLFEYHRRPTAH